LIAEKAQQLLELAEADGIEILVTSTLRTFEEQAELFAIGPQSQGRPS
jgi:LAS superfamily LD-carboxypeptidase LdcB